MFSYDIISFIFLGGYWLRLLELYFFFMIIVSDYISDGIGSDFLKCFFLKLFLFITVKNDVNVFG